MARRITRSDGETVDLELESAEQTDLECKAHVDIDVVHEMVHKGKLYHTSKVWLGVLDGTSVYMLVSGVNTHKTHLKYAIEAGGKTHFEAYAGTGASSKGTILSGVNMNISYPDSPVCGIYHTPTITSVGYSLMSGIISGGGGFANLLIGGSARGDTEWVLDGARYYLLRMSNASGGTVDVAANVEYYEIEK